MTFTDQLKVPRTLHPGAWWLWAGLVAIAASKTAPIWQLLLLAVACTTIAFARKISEWHWKNFSMIVTIAITISVMRVVLQIVFGAPVGNDVLFRLPTFELPEFLTGLRIGGPVTQSSVVTALTEASRISATVMVFGAAAAVTSMSRLLRSLPASLQSFGMLVIIAVTFVPNIFHDVTRIQSAQRWRGDSRNRISVLASNLIAICESALDRSVALAGSMTSRGYESPQQKSSHLTTGLFLCSLGLGVWMSFPHARAFAFITALAGAAFIGIHAIAASASNTRTQFRKSAWQLPEYLVLTCGALTLLLWQVAPAAVALSLALPLLLSPSIPVEVNTYVEA